MPSFRTEIQHDGVSTGRVRRTLWDYHAEVLGTSEKSPSAIRYPKPGSCAQLQRARGVLINQDRELFRSSSQVRSRHIVAQRAANRLLQN